MRNAHLAGRRYVKLVRCSKDEQADTSPDDQGRILDEYANEHGMIHAGDDIVLEGVSGSIPSLRTDIDRVILRKHESDDFDTLLLQDFSRFTRAGIEHGNALKWELAKVGIEVVFVTFGSTGDADQDGLIQSMGFYAAQQAAKAISQASTRGVMSSRAAGTVPHTPCVPYGIDRLYIGNDGVPRHRVRNLADGRQQMLHPTEEIVLRTFAANPDKGASIHYKRQSDERIVFVPGAKERVEIVRRIFRQNLLHGEGEYKIARTLNNEGVCSARGKLWSKDAVHSILMNPVYTGRGISGRYQTGIFNILGENASPKAIQRQLTTVARQKKGQKRFRPKDEWKWIESPDLRDYLGELRDLAIEMQEREFERQNKVAIAPPPKQKSGGDRHGESPFTLKGLLRSTQGNHPMTGRRAGSLQKPHRYYAVTRAFSAPKDGSPLARMIPAEPLERAVLNVVKDVLRDVPNLREQICSLVEQQRKAEKADHHELQSLLNEQAALQEQIADAMMLGPSTRRLMKDKFERWEAQSETLEERIAKAKQSVAAPDIDVDAAVRAVSHRFQKWADSIDSLPPSGIRKVLANVVSRLEVDLVTRQVRMELALPDGVTLAAKEPKPAKKGNEPMCLVEKSPSLSFDQAHRLAELKIAFIDCEGEQGRKNVPWCFTCRRQAA